MQQRNQIAIFGGGCFWCTEAVFESLNGVISVIAGYAGGTVEYPSYFEVAAGTTGHAEVVRIEYDPSIISYGELLAVFFATHDPTTKNKQGADVGTQYRSVILFADDSQKLEAGNFINNLKSSGAKVVTEVIPLASFFEAEDELRNYYDKNTSAPYCRLVIDPKLKKLQMKFAKLL
jgi:peptide-methionine (S)-S-oxide reductase